MDHDDQTIGRIFTRREAMAALAGTAIALSWGRSVARAKAPPASRPAALVVTPQLTEGPFFVDERLNRSDLLAGTTRPAVAQGLPLLLTMTVCKLTGTIATPMPGVTVDLWHADAAGVYSDEDHPMNAEITTGQRWLRGYQVTDGAGRATFRTIVPGWYDGRAPHIHFKVRQFAAATTRPATTAEFTSQLFFGERQIDAVYARAPYAGRGRRTTTNADDGIYNEPLTDGTPAGAALTLNLADHPGGGRAAACTIYLTDAALHAPLGHRRGPGGPGGPPPDDGFPF